MNILRRISVSYAALIAMIILVAAISYGTLSYMTGRLATQRAEQVRLATLTERVKGGFYSEIDSARGVLLERALHSPTKIDVELVALPVDQAEEQLQKVLPSAKSREAWKQFEDAAATFDTAHARVWNWLTSATSGDPPMSPPRSSIRRATMSRRH